MAKIREIRKKLKIKEISQKIKEVKKEKQENEEESLEEELEPSEDFEMPSSFSVGEKAAPVLHATTQEREPIERRLENVPSTPARIEINAPMHDYSASDYSEKEYEEDNRRLVRPVSLFSEERFEKPAEEIIPRRMQAQTPQSAGERWAAEQKNPERKYELGKEKLEIEKKRRIRA